VLYELAHREDLAPKEIGGELGLDPGYLSRIMQKLDDSALITRKPLASDRRQYRLGLTARAARLCKLDQSSHDEVEAMLGQLGDGERNQSRHAMATIERTLSAGRRAARCPARSHRPWRHRWVVSRHGAIYAQEFGWDISFEALVAEIAARVHQGQRSLSRALLDRGSGRRARRLDLPGQGLDEVRNCVCFWWRKRRAARDRARAEPTNASASRAKGLPVDHACGPKASWFAARDIYQRAGFRRVAEETHQQFGRRSRGETWEIKAVTHRRSGARVSANPESILAVVVMDSGFAARARAPRNDNLRRSPLRLRAAQMLIQPRHDLDELQGRVR